MRVVSSGSERTAGECLRGDRTGRFQLPLSFVTRFFPGWPQSFSQRMMHAESRPQLLLIRKSALVGGGPRFGKLAWRPIQCRGEDITSRVRVMFARHDMTRWTEQWHPTAESLGTEVEHVRRPPDLLRNVGLCT
jgi:hypothetical protein